VRGFMAAMRASFAGRTTPAGAGGGAASVDAVLWEQ
jgi:hypothetical protein